MARGLGAFVTREGLIEFALCEFALVAGRSKEIN